MLQNYFYRFLFTIYTRICCTYSWPEPGWWGAVLPGLTGAVPHHLTVDGTAHAVVKLHVELGQNISYKDDRRKIHMTTGYSLTFEIMTEGKKS